MLDCDEMLAALGAGNVENSLLRLIDEDIDVPLFLIASRGDIGVDLNQLAQDRFLADNLGITGNICRYRNDGGQARQVGDTADFFEFVLVVEKVGQGQKVLRFVFLEQIDQGFEDDSVGRLYKNRSPR